MLKHRLKKVVLGSTSTRLPQISLPPRWNRQHALMLRHL